MSCRSENYVILADKNGSVIGGEGGLELSKNFSYRDLSYQSSTVVHFGDSYYINNAVVKQLDGHI